VSSIPGSAVRPRHDELQDVTGATSCKQNSGKVERQYFRFPSWSFVTFVVNEFGFALWSSAVGAVGPRVSAEPA
jgi:hypothetical protein